MADYGIKVSQPGESASGPDQRLFFSSSWKVLPIINETSFTAVASGATIYTHNLGYVPLFLPYTTQRFQEADTPGIASFNHTFQGRVVANTTEIKILEFGPPTTSGRVITTAINIQEDYQASSVNLENITARGDIDRDYGIKVSLPGKDATSEDTRDFSIHSGTRTPMVHLVKTFVMPGGSATYTVQHDLGYPPMFFAYALITGNSGWQIVGSAGDTSTTATNTSISVTIGYQGSLSIVVLKDPLEFN